MSDYLDDDSTVTCDGCEETSESGWGDTPFCLSCAPAGTVCPEHQRTFIDKCPLDHEEGTE